MVASPRIHTRGAGRGSPQGSALQRWGALIGGGALAVYGITRRSPLGVALAAGGSTIALLGTRQGTRSRQPSATTTLLINCSPQDAYRFWRNFENLPRFMNRLQSVTPIDERRSRWVALGPMGRPIRWDAEITGEREDEYIAWRSLPNSDLQVDGRVEFRSAPANRGTLVSAHLEFRALPGTSNSLAYFLNKGASFVIRQDLRRLEALIETGEVPTTEGQPHGTRDFITGLARAADPTRPAAAGSSLREAFTERKGIA